MSATGSSAQKKLLSRALSPRLQAQLKSAGTSVDWQGVANLTRAPRGVPVPVSGQGGSEEAVLAAAPTVQNRVPHGSNWDGSDDTGTNGNSAQQLLSEREPASAPEPASRTPGG